MNGRTGSPTLYLGGRPLDPKSALLDSPLVDGSLVSLDDPRAGIGPEPEGSVEVRVVGGRGAGTVHRLGVGEATLGSDPSCAIVIDDPLVPAVAAVLTIDIDGVVTLLPQKGCELLLDRTNVDADGTTWPDTGEVTLGGALLELRRPSPPDASLLPSEDGAWLDYNRPPRLLPPVRQTSFRLPAEPEPPSRSGIPVVGVLAPVGLGVAMAVLLKQPEYLLMTAMSPVMMVGNSMSSKRQGKKSHRKLLKDHRELMKAISEDADAAVILERTARRRATPDAAELLMTAVGPRARLWERRRDDPDHLLLRIGTADLPSEVELDDPSQLQHRRQTTRIAEDVPVAVSLRDAGVIGVAGRADLPREVGRWLLGQLAVLQSPRDVQMYLLSDPSAAGTWEWAGWLPHLRPASGQDAIALIGTDTETLARRVAELNQMVDARRAAAAAHTSVAEPDVVVLLDGARRLRALPGVVSLLKEGPPVGVYCICLDGDERLLPEECTAVVTEGPDGLILRVQRADDITGVRADVVPAAWFNRVARALSPIRDVSDSGDESALPSSCRLLDVLGLEPPTAGAVAARWLVSGSSTSAVVGESLDGPFAIDLRRDGPHGLIAGTTGAGKSELLQTIVASLAVANRPDAMTFVLVDYKGGAAFKDCVDLPHTVGMVTDLDTHLVERALTSLGAELTRREHILAAAGAKDIEDYTDYARRDQSLAPLPRLLIVIDEFASMARELPDFVTGLVNIAQRGRSLGIHLILATQRPTGVVSPEIRANTNLRLALRVTDPAESSDVIDAPDAARISKSTPGRAYVRLGHASLVPFQAGRVGGRRPGATTVLKRADPFLAEIDWANLGRPVPQPPKAAAVDDLEATDLAVLVHEIGAANTQLSIPPQHSPWLPALTTTLTVGELDASSAAGDDHRIAPVPYALEDLPAEQDQRTKVIDFSSFGHLYIVGAPRSGRSQALRTIGAMIAQTASAADVHLFGVDCGNGALLPLAKLPNCGAIVQRTQVERATRLIGRLHAEVMRRQEQLGNGGFADITEQRGSSEPAGRLPHLVLMIDRWEGWTTTLGELDAGALTDQLFALLREGASVGVHVIVTGDRTLINGRVSTLTEDKISLRLTDRSDFSLVGLQPRKMPEDIAQGRGFQADSGIETQFALLDADSSGPSQAAAIARIADEATERDRSVPRNLRPFRVDVLPATLGFEDAWKMRDNDLERPLWALVGVGGDELIAMGPDLASDAPTFIVAGPPKSGRSTVLVTMAKSILRSGAQVVLAAPRQSPLRDLAGVSGVRAVLTGDDLTEAELAPLLTDGDGYVALIVDDAELVREIEAKDWLRSFLRTARDQRRAVIIAGNAEDVAGGFSGWQVDMKKNRAGALLSPQNLVDGELVGVRLPRSILSPQVQAGRALIHLGGGELITVQVPVLG